MRMCVARRDPAPVSALPHACHGTATVSYAVIEETEVGDASAGSGGGAGSTGAATVGQRWAFGLLGPLEADCDGVPLPVTAGKQRVVLAALLLEANRVVSFSTLVDLLWESDPPDAARATVQNYVMRLRQEARGERRRRPDRDAARGLRPRARRRRRGRGAIPEPGHESLGGALSNLGLIHRDAGRMDRALENQIQALEVMRSSGDRHGVVSRLDRQLDRLVGGDRGCDLAAEEDLPLSLARDEPAKFPGQRECCRGHQCSNSSLVA